MKIVNANVKEMYDSNPQKHIEAIGRICYKSEDNITNDSNKKFINGLYCMKHWAMLEHFRFIVSTGCSIYSLINEAKGNYIVCTSVDTNGHSRCVVSGSARAFIEAVDFVEHEIKYNKSTDFTYSHLAALMSVIQHIIHEYGCVELFGGKYTPCRQPSMVCISNVNCLTKHEWLMHGWHSVRFICDRGVSHELVRHRPASFAQESTRYCNYSKDKFDNQIAVIEPLFFKPDTEEYVLWKKCMMYDEEMYFELLRCGKKPQEARTVLPNSLKTDIVLTATNSEWKHIIDLRYKGVTGSPHPQMVEVMAMLVSHNLWASKIANDYFDGLS